MVSFSDDEILAISVLTENKGSHNAVHEEGLTGADDRHEINEDKSEDVDKYNGSNEERRGRIR